MLKVGTRFLKVDMKCCVGCGAICRGMWLLTCSWDWAKLQKPRQVGIHYSSPPNFAVTISGSTAIFYTAFYIEDFFHCNSNALVVFAGEKAFSQFVSLCVYYDRCSSSPYTVFFDSCLGNNAIWFILPFSINLQHACP